GCRQSAGTLVQVVDRRVGHLPQYRLGQLQLTNEAPALPAHRQMRAHRQALAQTQLRIQIITGQRDQLATVQHCPVSSKCSRVAKSLSRERCSNTRTLAWEISSSPAISSSSSICRSRSSSTLDCSSE